METLKKIQTLSKLGMILSKITFICCVIGVGGCILGMVSLQLVDLNALKIGGVTLHSFIVNQAGIDLNSLYPILTGCAIVSMGEAVTAKFAEKYFANELLAETPFTLEGAKELLRLGIITISVPLGALILAQIVSDIIAEFIKCEESFKLEDGGSVVLGVMFIFMSLICKCGAELLQKEEK